MEKESGWELQTFLTESVPERGDALIAKVYRDAPFFASRSEIVDLVITSEEERETILAWTRSENKRPELLTIGYEGDNIDGYLFRLIENNVKVLCDVRRNPLSRKTGFSKRQLHGYCEKVGIEYQHMPELGINGSRRRELNTTEDYEALFQEYCEEDLPEAGDALERLEEQIDAKERVALTCFEREPEMCHRHCVADELKNRRKNSPPVTHI